VLFLRPDAAARAEERTRVLVPEAALDQREGQTRVWLLRDGKAQAIAVTAGERAGGSVEIRGGLSGGEEIIVRPLADLRDGLPAHRSR